MMSRILKFVTAVMLIGSWTSGTAASISNAANVEDGPDGIVFGTQVAPGPNYVRVELTLLDEDRAVPAYWRLVSRPGFTWVEARWDGDRFFPGFWRPVAVKTRSVWVPGHWVGERWVPGRWREATRRNWTWIDGHWTRSGEWIEGYWRPVQQRPNKVWEPGYWDRRGRWVDGKWRDPVRKGYTWVPGGYDREGYWTEGHWVKARENQVWVRGYWDRGRWVDGHFEAVPEDRPNFVHGHYDSRGEWTAPHWRRNQDEEYQLRNSERQRGQMGEQEQVRRSEEQRGGPLPLGRDRVRRDDGRDTREYRSDDRDHDRTRTVPPGQERRPDKAVPPGQEKRREDKAVPPGQEQRNEQGNQSEKQREVKGAQGSFAQGQATPSLKDKEKAEVERTRR